MQTKQSLWKVMLDLTTEWGGCNHHRRHRVAGEGHCVIAPPCPRSTACLQRSPIRWVESFRSWSSHLFHERPGGRRHMRSGGRLRDTSMWSWKVMFAGVLSSSQATSPNTEMCHRDRRWDSEVRPVWIISCPATVVKPAEPPNYHPLYETLSTSEKFPKRKKISGKLGG